MARRIQPIFDAVLADPRIVGRERQFVESLQADFKRSGGLTPGRRRCLRQIEERLASAPKAIEAGLDSRLSSLETRAYSAGDAWATDFVKSLRGQVLGAGRFQSVKSRFSPRSRPATARRLRRNAITGLPPGLPTPIASAGSRSRSITTLQPVTSAD